MKKALSVVLCFGMLGSTGCGTLFGRSQDVVTIHSRDPEAAILVNGNEIGKGSATWPVKRGKNAIITASKKGCSDRTVVTEDSIAGAAYFNLLCLLCWIVDAATGKIRKTDPTDYTVTPACITMTTPLSSDAVRRAFVKVCGREPKEREIGIYVGASLAETLTESEVETILSDNSKGSPCASGGNYK